MIITICGTPGTGKTAVAEQLAKDIGYEYISLNQIVLDNNLGEKDRKRKTIAVAPQILKDFVDNMGLTNSVVDSLLSYAVTNDVCIVLRCNPTKLRERLSLKNWSEKKIQENVEAEMLAYIVVEALEHSDNVFEIDTTNLSVKEVIKICEHIVATKDTDYEVGKINWME